MNILILVNKRFIRVHLGGQAIHSPLHIPRNVQNIHNSQRQPMIPQMALGNRRHCILHARHIRLRSLQDFPKRQEYI